MGSSLDSNLWMVVLVMSNSLVSRYDRYWDFNDTRPLLSEETLMMLWNNNNPIEVSIDLEETDFRHRQITQHLRTLDTAGLEIPVTWLTASNPIRVERGVTLILSKKPTRRPHSLTHIPLPFRCRVWIATATLSSDKRISALPKMVAKPVF